MATVNLDGNGLFGVTGSGNTVGATSPTLITPNLGTPSALVLTNATALPIGALPTKPTFRVESSGGQTCASATYTKVSLDTETFDTNNTFDSTTNYRHTPTIAGKYLYTAQTALSGLAVTKQCGCVFYKNGVMIQFTGLYNGTTGGLQVPGTCLIDMNGSTDYVELYVWNGDTVSRSTSSAASFLCFLAANLVSI